MSWYTEHSQAMCEIADRIKATGDTDSAVLVLNAAVEIDRLERENAALVGTAPMTLDEVREAIDAIETDRGIVSEALTPVLATFDTRLIGIRNRCPHNWGGENQWGMRACKVCGKAVRA